MLDICDLAGQGRTWWHLRGLTALITLTGAGNSPEITKVRRHSSCERLMGQGATSTRLQLLGGAPREAWSCPVDTGTVKMWHQGYNESCVNMSVASSLWSVTHSASLWWTTITASRGRGRPQDLRAEDTSGKASLKVAEKRKIQIKVAQHLTTSDDSFSINVIIKRV